MENYIVKCIYIYIHILLYRTTTHLTYKPPCKNYITEHSTKPTEDLI